MAYSQMRALNSERMIMSLVETRRQPPLSMRNAKCQATAASCTGESAGRRSDIEEQDRYHRVIC